MKQNKMLQSGRSMVEMLGVLAVVGVLSIGGVMGYKYGMDKYRANETINELTIRAMGLMQQVSRGEIVELNMEMGDKTKLGYDVDAWIDERDPRYFYIAIANVPASVCRQILDAKWTLPTNIYGLSDGYVDYPGTAVCGTDGVTEQMDFEFFRDFAFVGDGDGVLDTNPIGRCSDPDKPLLGNRGDCYSCNEKDPVYVGTRGCTSVCPNRRLSPNGKACVLPCGEGVNAGKPLMEDWGNCYACSESATIYVGDDGACESVCGDLRYKDGNSCKLKK